MKNSINLLLVLSLLFAVSCKKKKENPEPKASSLALTQVPQRIDGSIDLYYEYKILNDTSKFRQSSILARFYKEARHQDSISYLNFDADVGNITINDSTFIKAVMGTVTEYVYYPTLAVEIEQIKKGRIWNISGNGSFKKMSIIDNTPLPEYFATVLPDTLFKNFDNTIKLGNYTGAAPIQVVIRFPNGYTRPKIPFRSAKKITLTKSDFSSFFEFETINVTIQFNLITTSYQTIEGKVLRLISHISYETYEIPFKF